MAATSILTSHGLTNEQWKAQLFKLYQEGTFFGRFKGTDGKSIVSVQRDLQKQAGDAITFGFANTIRGTAGVTGNTPLEGHDGSNYVVNNEAMTFNYQRVVIDQIRQSIKISGTLDEKRVAFSLREQAKGQLTDWMSYNEDQALFTAVNTADEIAGALSTVTITGGLTYDNIVDIKKEAMFPTTNNVTGGAATTLKLEPIKIENGEEMFILGVNPTDAAAFKKSTDYKDFNKLAEMRGSGNPIFTGALGVFNNVVIHEHSSFEVNKPVLMGANAMFLAYGDEIMYGEDTFDYDNQTGFMIGSVRGVALAEHDGGGSYGAIKVDIA